MLTKIKNICAASALVLLVPPLPSVAQDTDLETLQRGEKVFNEIAGLGCKSCHGEFAEGDLGVGPYIRGASEGTIRAAIEGIDAMVVVKMNIDEQGINDVAAYVNSLGSTSIIRTLAKKGRFLPDSATVAPNSRFQIVINNSSFQPRVYKSEDLGIAQGTQVAARQTGVISWTSPAKGSFKLHCDDCKLSDQFFTITVDPNAVNANKIQGVADKTSQQDSNM